MAKQKLNITLLIIPALLLGIDTFYYKVSEILSDKTAILTFIPKIPFIDDKIPIIHEFIYIYILAYVFWYIYSLLAGFTGVEKFSDYIAGFFLAHTFGFIIFCLFPSVMNRTDEGIFLNLGTDISSRFHHWFITHFDGGEIAHGLLPSFHCESSVICYLGVRKCPEIPKYLRVTALVMTVLIIISVLVLKQHYVLDAISGTGLSIVFYLLARKYHFGKVLIPALKRFGIN